MKRLLVLSLSLLLGLAPEAASIICPPRFQNFYMDEMSTPEQEQFFLLAQVVLGQLNDPEATRLIRAFTQDVLDAFESPTVSGVRFDNTLVPWMRAIEGLFAERYSLDEFKAAFRAADEMRRNGVLLPGIVQRAPTDTSSSWISAVYNRGHLFEMAGAAHLTRAGGPGGGPLVVKTNIKGFGYRVLVDGAPLEGDLVELIPGGERWIDFKGASGNYGLDELARIERALRGGAVKEFIFAVQAGTTPPAAWTAEIAAINQGLPVGVRRIALVEAGGFQ